MGKYSGKTCRLLSMLSMTASFFLVEIIVGYITNSVALVADSFHMLSDVVALIVGFSSVRVSFPEPGYIFQGQDTFSRARVSFPGPWCTFMHGFQNNFAQWLSSRRRSAI